MSRLCAYVVVVCIGTYGHYGALNQVCVVACAYTDSCGFSFTYACLFLFLIFCLMVITRPARHQMR